VYDGVEGKKKGEFSAKDEHKMSIFSSAFSPDGKSLFTSSADKTCKLWDVTSGEVVATFSSGTDLTDTPVGVAWVCC
jgi:WD40 repeat protein